MYVYCVLSCNAKRSPKQLPNCLKRSETIVVLIVYNTVLYDISTYTVAVFSVALHESTTRKALLVKALLWKHDLLFAKCQIEPTFNIISPYRTHPA
jgi:hypothetical protein